MKRAFSIAIFLLAASAWADWRGAFDDAYFARRVDERVTIPDLVAHYKMNDNAASVTVEDSFASYDGAASKNTADMSVAGKINTAFLFDGANDYVAITGFPNIVTNITICTWIKPGSGTARVIVAKPHSTTHVSPYFKYCVYYDGGGTPQQINFRLDSVVVRSGTGKTCASNVWSHVACRYDGTNMDIYINAELANSGARSGAIQTSTHPLYIGQNVVGGERFDGAIDDVRLYYRALTTNEIAAFYNAGNGTEEE